MDAWILLSIAAAFVQTLRFMVQKHLKATRLSTGGATLARFVFAAPIAAVFVVGYLWATNQQLAFSGGRFWAFALVGGLSQVLATMCTVALFSHRNFAVGITLKKTEVMMTALAGIVILGEGVGWFGAAALATGLVGVLFLSDPPDIVGSGLRRFFNRAAGLGLLSGLFFALSAVSYRGATLEVLSDDPVLRAAATLAVVTAAQLIGLGLWLALREAGQLAEVGRAWRAVVLAGVFSVLGSFFWFAAFTLQNAAYVFAVGQVELIFSLAASVLFFRETVSPREITGIAFIAASILLLVLYA